MRMFFVFYSESLIRFSGMSDFLKGQVHLRIQVHCHNEWFEFELFIAREFRFLFSVQDAFPRESSKTLYRLTFRR